MNIPFLDLKQQFKQIQQDVMPVITEAMTNGAFIGGPNVAGFEKEFAAFCDSRFCVGVGSGTDALRFALMAAGVGQDDEVITVPNTFIATTEAISQVGAAPVFVDIKADTCNMNPDNIKACITEKTRAIVPVHLYGQVADMDAIVQIAEQHNLVVIEDACQAHGALYNGKKAGSMGAVGCFSFYPGKNLGAFGEGGAIVTQDEQLAKKISMIRDHGQKKKYFHQIEGFNGRLDAIQAAVLRIKLNHLPSWNENRRQHARYYNELLADVPGITLPFEEQFSKSVYHLYVIHVENRDELQSYLSAKGIATGLHYPMPLHLQEAYRHLDYQKGAFPVTEHSAAHLLSLPMFPELKKDQIEYVAEQVIQFFTNQTSK
jgi:dTDP-4-amino-4,6-dideoxygalactose transaminase